MKSSPLWLQTLSLAQEHRLVSAQAFFLNVDEGIIKNFSTFSSLFITSLRQFRKITLVDMMPLFTCFTLKSTVIYCLIWLFANIILSPLIYFLLTSSDIFGDHDWSIRSLLLSYWYGGRSLCSFYLLLCLENYLVEHLLKKFN